jgi:hypothetical protein
VVADGTVSPMKMVPDVAPVFWAVNVSVMGVEEPAYTVDGAADLVTTKLAAFEGPPPELVGPFTLTVTCTDAPWQAF